MFREFQLFIILGSFLNAFDALKKKRRNFVKLSLKEKRFHNVFAVYTCIKAHLLWQTYLHRNIYDEVHSVGRISALMNLKIENVCYVLYFKLNGKKYTVKNMVRMLRYVNNIVDNNLLPTILNILSVWLRS